MRVTTIPGAAGGIVDIVSTYKFPGESVAGTPTAEEVQLAIPPCTLTGAQFFPGASVVTDDTDYARLAIGLCDGAGSATEAAWADTTTTYAGDTASDWSNLAAVNFTLTDPDATSINAITFATAKFGAGRAVPRGLLVVYGRLPL